MAWLSIFHKLAWVYAVLNIVLALFSLNILILLILAIFHRRPPQIPTTTDLSEYPSVLVQLPIYNERFVVERLIDSATALDYPRDRLIIQVLDDSTDQTNLIAEARVNFHRERGVNIQYLHRNNRTGFKAGALAEGLHHASGDLVAIFDADFIPPADFLKRLVPEFLRDPRVGIVQARWEHLNRDQNAITQIIALGLDLHFAVDQVARSRSGMLMNNNGSGCILRRQCIEEAGGWQSDTLVEDTDLSYRAQLKGWKIVYRPDVTAPGELPATILAFKQQQFRWAKGILQTLIKLGGRIIASRRPFLHKLGGLVHLSMYLAGPLMLFSFLLSLPVIYLHGHLPINLAFLSAVAFIPPIAIFYSQVSLRRDWKNFVIYYPLLSLISIGLSVTLTRAAWEAFTGRQSPFVRTPKFAAANAKHADYALPLDQATYWEMFLCLYGLGTASIALHRAPHIVPFLLLYALGYGVTAFLSIQQSSNLRHALRAKPILGD
uniref:Glycosyltransferase n=1 Tax=Anaerolinea thermolimosa TaxID=229919 RepID=A0A7C4KHX9_9CHLR